MAEPAGEGGSGNVGVLGGNVDEGGGAGAAVEVLVGAADGEVGLCAGDVDRNGAGGVGEVPDDEGAGGVGAGDERGHVVEAAGAVVDLGQEDDGDLFGDRGGDVLGGGGAEFVAAVEEGGQALCHVEVGGEVAVVRQDDLAVGAERQGRGEGLEDLYREGVAEDDGARGGADQASDAVAELARLAGPAAGVPRADKLAAPVLDHRAVDRLHCRDRQRAEGVAVEIDHALGEGEEGAGAGEVGGHTMPPLPPATAGRSAETLAR